VLAMPAEASGHDRLVFEYGDDFGRHIEEFDPDWVKILVRFNPDDPQDMQQDQIRQMRRLHDWVSANHRRWLLELLVPATRAQLAEHDDQAAYDKHVRPGLTVQVIKTLSAAGVHPGIWKLEGYETTEGAEQVLEAVRAAGSPPSDCIVLGRNAPKHQVDHWLDVAAPLEGFVGFAIGRSIWDEAIADYVAGKKGRSHTEETIAERYHHFIKRYLKADTAPADGRESEPFSYTHPRLTPDREAEIRKAASGAEPRGSYLPAWMVQSLLAEVDGLRSEF
jgi:myo-inositol catabolism protein IolC